MVFIYHFIENSLSLSWEGLEDFLNASTKGIDVLYEYWIYIQIIDMLKKTITSCAFIKVIDEVEDWQQLLLMSACSHNIIANSSFSWWGAYLNTNPTKIVCYPEIWFGSKATHDTKDLFPESWTKISCV